MNMFRIVLSQKNMKIYSKTHQIALFKNISLGGGACPRTYASPARNLPRPPKSFAPTPWQILHTPMLSPRLFDHDSLRSHIPGDKELDLHFLTIHCYQFSLSTCKTVLCLLKIRYGRQCVS